MSSENCGAIPCEAQIQTQLCGWLKLGRIYNGENMQLRKVYLSYCHLKCLDSGHLLARWAVRPALAVAVGESPNLLETALDSVWSVWTHTCAALPRICCARHRSCEAVVGGHVCCVTIAAAVDLEALQHLPSCRRQDVDMPQ